VRVAGASPPGLTLAYPRRSVPRSRCTQLYVRPATVRSHRDGPAACAGLTTPPAGVPPPTADTYTPASGSGSLPQTMAWLLNRPLLLGAVALSSAASVAPQPDCSWW
jgi:hypothetical protein